MRGRQSRSAAVLLALALLGALWLPAEAAVSGESLEQAVQDTADYLYRTVAAPQVGSTGGEWAVLGLARSGCEGPEGYYRDYYAGVEAYVAALEGKLHERKYSEYSRVVMAVSAMGRDARNVAGYDLTQPLGDYEKTVWQGVNGPSWALLALDSRDYPMPEAPGAAVQATRQMYIDHILACQLPGGGWNLSGDAGEGADPDVTGMALQALAKYQDQGPVAQATQAALERMSAMQDAQGGFSAWGTDNLESCVQMVCALAELGIPLEDSRFVKQGNTLLDALMGYYVPGQGFLHTADSARSDQMASEQGFYALVAARRLSRGENSLYRMGDAGTAPGLTGEAEGRGLAGKSPRVHLRPVTSPGKRFGDVTGEEAPAIEALAARGIVDGRGEGLFCPEELMTRAEFATIVVRALGLETVAPEEGCSYRDVPRDAWYFPYVETASYDGVVKGRGAEGFDPEGGITRQEAAVMLARAARLCGLETTLNAGAVRDVLAQFGDYVTTAEWARQELAFCYRMGILEDEELDIQPEKAVSRGEMARMVYRLLDRADLL